MQITIIHGGRSATQHPARPAAHLLYRQEQSGSPGWQLHAFLAGESPPPLEPPPAAARASPCCAFCASASLAFSSARVLSSCAEESWETRSLTLVVCSSSWRCNRLASSACAMIAAREAASRASASGLILPK